MTSPPPFKLDMSDPLSVWRAESFWDKEVETLEWLRFFSSFQKTSIDTLVDVGANIGIYSLYWLSLRDTSKAISCEPLPDNVRLLKKNFDLNEYQNRVTVVEEPIYSSLTKGQIHVPDNRPASSGAQFSSTSDSQTRGMIKANATTLDMIVPNLCVGYILKIDIDGLDFEALKGGAKSLKSGSIKSVLIEASDQIQTQIEAFLVNFSFVADKRFNNLNGHSDNRRKRQNRQERNRIYSLTSTF